MKKKIRLFSLLTAFLVLFVASIAYASDDSVQATFDDSTALITNSAYLDVSGNSELTLSIDSGGECTAVEFTANVYKRGWGGIFPDTMIDKYTPDDPDGGSKTIKVGSGKYYVQLVRSYSSINATATLSK